MPCNPHYREMINTRPSHIGDSGMPEIMESKILNSCTPTSTIKGGLKFYDKEGIVTDYNGVPIE